MTASRFYMSAQDAACMQDALQILDDVAASPACHAYAPAVVMPLVRCIARPARQSSDSGGNHNSGRMVVTAGGVCDEQFRQRAGYTSIRPERIRQLRTQDYPAFTACQSTCQRLAYIGSIKPRDSAAVERRDESVIFLGDLHMHFGHTLTDSLARMWYVIRNPGDRRRLVMLRHAYWDWSSCDPAASYHRELLRLLGIDWERIVIVERPTRFAEVTVPDQAVHWDGGTCSRGELLDVYDAAAERIRPRSGGKLYLSRRSWRDRVAGEEYFEDYFARQGFEVICPEQLPLEEQLSRVAGAEVLACPQGTLSHLTLFARPGTRLINLWRHQRQYSPRQQLIDRLRELDSVYVDTAAADTRFRHDGMVPTLHWERFVSSGWLAG